MGTGLKGRYMIIVSLTSWNKRIDQARDTVDSLLKQTRKPDRIELNLDLQNFPQAYGSTPRWIREYTEKYDNFYVYFEIVDLKVYSKIMPTIVRHARELENTTVITCDDDVHYPIRYVEEIENNMKDNDWLCSQHNVITQGQFMAYSGKALKAFYVEIDRDFMNNVLLDDNGLFWIMYKYRLKRGKKIESKCEDRQAGYSFRRLFVKCDDVSELKDSTCEYPPEQFIKERDYLIRRGIIRPIIKK